MRTARLSTTGDRVSSSASAAYVEGCKVAIAGPLQKKGEGLFRSRLNLPDVVFENNGETIGADLGVTCPAVHQR
jgi:hypothetical protein